MLAILAILCTGLPITTTIFGKWLNSLIVHDIDKSIKATYSLFVCASYFISCSVHAQFASVTFINCKWCWGCRHF